jgi:hypothetical protein
MMKNRVSKILRIAMFALLFVTVFGFVVMRLWNWLIPGLFGWHPLSFWQAIGLLVLSKILFGGFHGRHGGQMHWRRRMTERWEHMTPEEREKFRHCMGGRWGSFDPPAATPKA